MCYAKALFPEQLGKCSFKGWSAGKLLAISNILEILRSGYENNIYNS